jgi:hypothetical protein
MFGRGWRPGQATIVALKEIRSIGRHGGIDSGGSKMKTYDFVADVQPTGGGAVFRTVMHEPFDERVWRQPSVGDVVPVKCDPGRQKAKFDTAAVTARDKAQKEATKTEQAAQFDAMVNASPGSPATESDVVRDSDGALRHADGRPYIPSVEELREGLRRKRGEQPAAQRPPAAKPGDRLERLQELADLHDRGVLTDAEFSAEKARILDQD